MHTVAVSLIHFGRQTSGQVLGFYSCLQQLSGRGGHVVTAERISLISLRKLLHFFEIVRERDAFLKKKVHSFLRHALRPVYVRKTFSLYVLYER